MQRTNPLVKDEQGDARNLMRGAHAATRDSDCDIHNQIFGSNIFCLGVLGPLPMMDALLPWSFRMRWLTFCIKYLVFHATMTEHNRK